MAAPALADGMIVKRVHYHHHYRLPPPRHVVEKVSPPWSGNYLLNGTWMHAQTPRCARWVAGDRVKLVAGDWHRSCGGAVVRNLSRHMTCELSCGW
jgi:hypothetical protein